jgi:Flp pilus assembly protein TadD/nucleoside phosphorylase
MTTSRPSRREDFEIAIICALPLEYDAVSLLFDKFWDEDGDQYGKVAGDLNSYTPGRIGKHNIVLALLHRMGRASAAGAAAIMRASYSGLRLVFLVGICGGVPQAGDDEILLGDVVISKTIVPYDFGRQYPDKFIRKDTVEGNLGMPNREIRNLLLMFETDRGRDQLRQSTADFLRQLQANAGQANRQGKYKYPGTVDDKLFEPSYRHKHRVSPRCICNECHGRFDPVCDEALGSSCDNLGCDEQHLVTRERLETKRRLERDKSDEAQEPAIYIGSVASGDTVMKSGEDRDRIAKEEIIIAFEMEGAGVWEEVPCIVVKGVCDYADCHKNKRWQNFAAATAASATKAILERYIQMDMPRERFVEKVPQCHWVVPFGRNKDFVGRESVLAQLLEMIPPSADEKNCQRTAIEGLGGVGKTQIALEAAFRVQGEHPDCGVFWVPAVDAATFENAYREIGRQLKIEGIDKDEADVKSLVKTALSQSADNWLLIIDNADDVKLLFGTTGATPLCDYLPFSHKGSILFTTRNHEAVVKLDIPLRSIVDLAEMSRPEAVDLLQKNLAAHQISDTQSTASLLDFLANLPLAIKQASAYMAKTGIGVTKYLNYCRLSDEHLIKLLSKDFEDCARYKSIQNPVATTWLISFSHITRDNQLAAKYLRFMSFLAEKEISKSLLPPCDNELETYEAIGTLRAYAFITERAGQESYDIHRLVQLAMRNWLVEKGELKVFVTSVTQRLDEVFPFPKHENRVVWMRYLPHALTALGFRDSSTDEVAKSSLLFNVAESNFILGKYQDAEELYQQALELQVKVLGAEHPSILASMNNLALVLRSQGRYEEAETIHRQTLELTTKVLGAEHPSTLASMNNLALVFGSQWKYEHAETIHRQSLELKTKVLGAEHPDTLASINNLALILRSQGKYEEAETMHRQELQLMTKVLGAEHPSTLASMNNLAALLDSQGKYVEAETMHRQELQLMTMVLGADHPSTLGSMNNLAAVLGSRGKYEEAETIHRQTLELKTKVLGAEHPDTFASMNNLAVALYSQGKYEEAETINRQTLELKMKVLGAEHPCTLHSMNNLAIVLGSQGKNREAETLIRQELQLRTKVFGAEHPSILGRMNNLALVLGSQEKYEEAETLIRQELQVKTKVLGVSIPLPFEVVGRTADLYSFCYMVRKIWKSLVPTA